jgi:VWFA-related protein
MDMKLAASAIFLSGLVLSPSPVLLSAGQANGQKKQDQKLVIGTSEVMVDVVVRDKKGRPVNGLGQSNFQVLEDGVSQQIESFREVRREPPSSAEELARRDSSGGTTVPTRRDPYSGISVVALVFDRLNPGARALAQKAAENYVTQALKPDDLTGVFAIGAGLNLVQPYTSDARLLTEAIRRAGAESANTFTPNADKIRDLIDQKEAAADQQSAAIATAGPSNPGAGTAIGAQAAELALLQTALQAEESYETLERSEQGLATDYALMSVIDSLAKIPGRKAIMFFSEGMSIPAAVQTSFQSVISAANRGNVTIYPIDAGGLRAESTLSNTAKDLKSLAMERSRQAASGRNDQAGPMTRDLEKNEDVLRRDPHSGLGMLADQTGGFMISDTNSLTDGLRHVDEDLRSHYELTYISKNQDYDGRFRAIAVKVDKSGLEVQSRKGYYALNAGLSSPVLGFEVPALAAMNKGVGTLPVLVSGMNFPEDKHQGHVTILAESPGKSFTYNVDKAKNQFSSDFVIVALIKNESSETVKKLSQHYQLSGSADKAAAAANQDILFYREVDLPAGKYTVETVAYDAPSGKAGVKTATVEVPNAAGDRLRLSSIVVIRRADKLSESEKNISNPFHYEGMLLYPNLGVPLKKTAGGRLGFFFDVYPAKSIASPPKLTIELLANGASQVTLPAELGQRDSTGRIQYASAFPLDAFPPGRYELKITVADGKDTVSHSVGFAVEL